MRFDSAQYRKETYCRSQSLDNPRPLTRDDARRAIRRVAHGVPLVVVFALSACVDEDAELAEQVNRRKFVELAEEWSVPIPRLDRYTGPFASSKVRSFVAGSGVAAVLTEDPAALLLFWLSYPEAPAAGPIERPPGWPGLAIKEAVQVLMVTDSGRAWVLDRGMRRVVSSDLGAQRSLVGRLDSPDSLGSACAIGGRKLMLSSQSSPGWLVRIPLDSIGGRDSVRVAAWDRDSPEDWRDVRLLTATESRCLAFNHRHPSRIFLVDSLGRSLKLSPLDPQTERTRFRGQLWARPPRPAVLDVAVLPGGVAMLVGGRSQLTGRSVDFFDSAGNYVGSALLTKRAHRIAGNQRMLLVLGLNRESSLTALALPSALRRAGAVPSEAGAGSIGAVDTTRSVLRSAESDRERRNRPSQPSTPR
jgi:hypothetical protein